jgi:hypothetical protein
VTVILVFLFVVDDEDEEELDETDVRLLLRCSLALRLGPTAPTQRQEEPSRLLPAKAGTALHGIYKRLKLSVNWNYWYHWTRCLTVDCCNYASTVPEKVG